MLNHCPRYSNDTEKYRFKVMFLYSSPLSFCKGGLCEVLRKIIHLNRDNLQITLFAMPLNNV